MTHNYKRNGTTTLFAALNLLDGTVMGRNMQRHRHQEFIRFLNALEREIPTGKVVHAILDNVSSHKTPEVRRWLARHPRWTFPHHRPGAGQGRDHARQHGLQHEAMVLARGETCARMTGKRRKVARNTSQKSRTGSQTPPNHPNIHIIPSKSRFPEVSS